MITSFNSAQVSFIVDRIHVSKSNRAVIRTLYDRLKRMKRAQVSRELRTVRHDLYRAALERHRANRDIYNYVMGGIA